MSESVPELTILRDALEAQRKTIRARNREIQELKLLRDTLYSAMDGLDVSATLARHEAEMTSLRRKYRERGRSINNLLQVIAALKGNPGK